MQDINIPSLIPHAGSMVLIDRVVAWDQDEITCAATSHRRTSNPLRNDDGLPATAGAEYGGQAAALHGGLLGRRADGYLVALRDFRLNVARLDQVADDLIIHARCLAADDQGIVYTFEVMQEQGASALVSGRVTVALMGNK